nr:hypothetical protein BaRGS_007234 [Batillaria attramentaria]
MKLSCLVALMAVVAMVSSRPHVSTETVTSDARKGESPQVVVNVVMKADVGKAQKNKDKHQESLGNSVVGEADDGVEAEAVQDGKSCAIADPRLERNMDISEPDEWEPFRFILALVAGFFGTIPILSARRAAKLLLPNPHLTADEKPN